VIGVVGRVERVPLGGTLRASGTGWYPLLALCGLVFADVVVTTVAASVTVEVRRSVGPGALASFEVYRLVFFAAASVGTVRAARRHHRVTIARLAVIASGLGALGAAMSTSSFAVTASAMASAVAAGVAATVLAPLLIDAHRPEVRVRTAAAYAGAVLGGVGVSALIVTSVTGAGLTWRVGLLVAAALAAGAAAASAWLDEIQVGRHDRARVTALVERQFGSSTPTTAPVDLVDSSLGFTEEFRRVWAASSAPVLLSLAALFGTFTDALPPFLDALLRDRWDLVAPSRSFAYGVLCLAGLTVVACFAGRGERALRASPARLLRITGSVVTATAVALAGAAVAPVFALTATLLAIACGGFSVMLTVAVAGLLTITEPVRRAHAAALVGVAVLAGGVVGHQLLATIGSRFGAAWALEALAVTVLASARALWASAASADRDVEALVARMVEVDELRSRVAQGEHMPLLSCRHVDFAYGQVQVLFDVSLTVQEGEMVALLGTNGAGKSTLLRLISGLGFPSAGSIHYRGADITFLDTDRRVQLGITQVPGGRAVFGAMSVVDNLRAYGYSLGGDRARLDRGIDEAFSAFPRLGERRNQLAATLSGGEQQMLGLAKAFILEPRLLVIDELSLGLAPKLVGELLHMVHRINERGTAVVLVEQSVNVALSAVDHAYFMEKGEIRFDGVAHDLLERPDLLRSVFLEGAVTVAGTAGA
jgi:ABC-type branched-subunit amino acid transport system ATPase component